MATDVISNLAGSLDAELEKARETLRSVDDDIKKVFGKDASELTVFGRNRRGGPQDGGKEDLLQHYNNDHFQQSGGPGGGGRRRRDGGEFDRDGDEPNEKRRRGEDGRFGGGGGGAFGGRLGPMATTPGGGGGNGPRFGVGGRRESIDGNNGDFAQYAQVGRRLASRVVSSGKDKSRDEVLAEQRQDSSGRDRNRRMFGALLGTLQRFKQDETKLKDKEDKRAQIEAKLDEAAKHEKEEVKTKKQELIKERKIKLTEIKRIEVKRCRLAELEQWEDKTKFLTNFIRTEAKPHIFYLPKIMNPIMECRLEQSKQCVTEMISHKRKLVLEDLEDYEQRSKRYWEGRVAGKNTGRRIDPMDADIEDELHEIMKSDNVDIPLEDEHLDDEGEDFTVTVFTTTTEENEDEKDSSSALPIKSETNGIKTNPNEDSSDDDDDTGKGKENIMKDEPMDDDGENNSPAKVAAEADAGSGDDDEEEVTEETTIEVKVEEEQDVVMNNTSGEVGGGGSDEVTRSQEEDEQGDDDDDDGDSDSADQEEDA